MATREVRRMNITDDERPSILFFLFLPVTVLGSFPFGCLGCRLSFDFITLGIYFLSLSLPFFGLRAFSMYHSTNGQDLGTRPDEKVGGISYLREEVVWEGVYIF